MLYVRECAGYLVAVCPVAMDRAWNMPCRTALCGPQRLLMADLGRQQ